MACPTNHVDHGAAPLPPPPWSWILAPRADRVPFPTTCGCSVWRRRGSAPDVYYVGHESYTCALRRCDADLVVGAAEPVAVPRLMLTSALWWCHVDDVYARIFAAQKAVIA